MSRRPKAAKKSIWGEIVIFNSYFHMHERIHIQNSGSCTVKLIYQINTKKGINSIFIFIITKCVICCIEENICLCLNLLSFITITAITMWTIMAQIALKFGEKRQSFW